MNNIENTAGDSRKPKPKNYYLDGITQSVAKRIAKYTFGSRLIQFLKDKENMEYVVYVKKDTDEAVIKHLKEHFRCFKIVKVSTEEVD